MNHLKYLIDSITLRTVGGVELEEHEKKILKVCKEIAKDTAVSYARSIIPQGVDIDTLGSAVARMNQVGWNECRIAMLNSIEQDSLDLHTN